MIKMPSKLAIIVKFTLFLFLLFVLYHNYGGILYMDKQQIDINKGMYTHCHRELSLPIV